METTALEVQKQQVALIVQEAQVFQVVDRESFEAVTEKLKIIKALSKQVDDFIGPLVKSAHEAWKAVKERENQLQNPLREAKDVYARKAGTWLAEQDRIRRDEEARLRKIEQERLDAEAVAKAEALAAEGKTKEAEFVLRDAPIAAPVKLEPVTKIAGTSTRTDYKYEVEDEALIPREYMMPNDKKIGERVRTFGDLHKIPGIRVWAETKVHARN